MRLVALPGVALAALLLSSCSGSEPAPVRDEVTDVADVAWSPCDGLTAERVSEIAGEKVTMDNGTRDSPRCAFVPEVAGGAAFEVSYLFYDGGLDEALDMMGEAGDQLHPIDVDGATAARLATRTTASAVAITGFVETDGLVQSVNAADLAPYDAAALARATRDLLAALVQAVPE